MRGCSVHPLVRFSALAAIAVGLCVGTGCSASARPPSDGDSIGLDPKARPASAPRERVGRAERDPARESTGVASGEPRDLVGERMAFQSRVAERLQKLEQRAQAATRPRSADPEAAAQLAKLIKAHDEQRRACVEAQDALVITPNDRWPLASEQLEAKLDALDGLVAKMEGSPGADAP